MKTFEEYKSLFKRKVSQEDLGILSGYNLCLSKTGMLKAGSKIYDRFMLFKDSLNSSWIPLIKETNADKVAILTFESKGKVFSCLLLTVGIASDEMLRDISEQFKAYNLSDVYAPSTISDFSKLKDELSWIGSSDSYTDLLTKSVGTGKLKSLSQLSKAQISGEILKKNKLVQYQVKFNSKKWQ